MYFPLHSDFLAANLWNGLRALSFTQMLVNVHDCHTGVKSGHVPALFSYLWWFTDGMKSKLFSMNSWLPPPSQQFFPSWTLSSPTKYPMFLPRCMSTLCSFHLISWSSFSPSGESFLSITIQLFEDPFWNCSQFL